MSKVLPILFDADMVRAIQNGNKTVIRRVVKPANPFRNKEGYCQGNGLWIDGYRKDDEPNGHIKDYSVSSCWWPKRSYIEKYALYQPEDVIYVREAWRVGAWDIRNQMIAFDYKDGTCGELTYIHDCELFERLVYQSRDDARKAKCEYNGVDFVWKKGKSPCRWHPSIHMPKEAARIWLRVTDIRVKRLQDITLAEALKEGIADLWIDDARPLKLSEVAGNKNEFTDRWNSTIKKSELPLYGWNANPWVWVIDFERYEKPKVTR